MRTGLQRGCVWGLLLLGSAPVAMAGAMDYATQARIICERIRRSPLETPLPQISSSGELREFVKSECLDEKYREALRSYWTHQLGLKERISLDDLHKSKDGLGNPLHTKMLEDFAYLSLGNMDAVLDFYERKNPQQIAFLLYSDTGYRKKDAEMGLRFLARSLSPHDRTIRPLANVRKSTTNADELEKLSRIEAYAREAECNKYDASAYEVSRAWFTEKKVSACKGVEERICGENFKNCLLVGGHGTQPLLRRIENFVTLAPVHMITQIITEERSFDEIFTTTQGVTVPLWSYVRNNIFGTALTHVMPPDSLPNIQRMAAIPEDTSLNQVTWYERGLRHPGILSTLSFQMRRDAYHLSSTAKAARVLDVFLCDKVRHSNMLPARPSLAVNLSDNAFCAECHQKLDAVASFFNRWGNFQTDRGYSYDPKVTIYDGGELYGKRDVTQLGLARLLVKEPRFDVCSVKHAYRFLTGQEMQPAIERKYMPLFLEKYTSHKKNMQALLLDLAQLIFRQGG